MSEAMSGALTPSETGTVDQSCYVVMRSLLLHSHVFRLGEIREAGEFGSHLVRLHDCGHVRCIDAFSFLSD